MDNTKDIKQQNIDKVFDIAYSHYEKAKNCDNDDEKRLNMELFYINFLKPIYDVLSNERGVLMISIDNYKNDNTQSTLYKSSFVDKNGRCKSGTTGYNYKATALIKLIAAFSSKANAERIE